MYGVQISRRASQKTQVVKMAVKRNCGMFPSYFDDKRFLHSTLGITPNVDVELVRKPKIMTCSKPNLRRTDNNYGSRPVPSRRTAWKKINCDLFLRELFPRTGRIDSRSIFRSTISRQTAQKAPQDQLKPLSRVHVSLLITVRIS